MKQSVPGGGRGPQEAGIWGRVGGCRAETVGRYHRPSDVRGGEGSSPSGPTMIALRHLPPAEQLALVARAQAGDLRARDRLIATNQRLVIKLARQFPRPQHLDLDDLVQEGNLGLLLAVEKYDVSKGAKFSTLARWWIRAAILRLLLNQARMVKVGKTDTERTIFYALCRAPHASDEAIAAQYNLQAAQVREMRRRMEPEPSLDARRTPHAPSTAACSPEEILGQEQEAAALRLAIREAPLTALERLLVPRWESGGEIKMQEVADAIGVSRSRIGQVEKSALRKLRSALARRGITDVLCPR